MSAPTRPERCACEATPAGDPTLAEHEKWCPSRKPSRERIAEIKAGTGRPLMAGELEWLGGDGSRAELHVSGAAAGAFPLSDDLPGWVAELGGKLAAVVAELGRTRAVLDQSENDLTGARLSLWEEERDNARHILAWRSAHARSRRRAVAVRRLRAERHATNETLSKAVEEAREKDAQLAAVRDAVAEAIMCPDEDCDGHLKKLERLLGGVGLLPPAAEQTAPSDGKCVHLQPGGCCSGPGFCAHACSIEDGAR